MSANYINKKFFLLYLKYLVPANTALEEWESSVAISFFLSNAKHPDKQVKVPKCAWQTNNHKLAYKLSTQVLGCDLCSKFLVERNNIWIWNPEAWDLPTKFLFSQPCLSFIVKAKYSLHRYEKTRIMLQYLL